MLIHISKDANDRHTVLQMWKDFAILDQCQVKLIMKISFAS